MEALRAEQIENFEKYLKKDKSNKNEKLNEQIKLIKNKLEKININPNYDTNLELNENFKNLNKQLERVEIKSIISDKNKNFIKDEKIGNFTLRYQVLTGLPTKELKNIVDQGKKDIKEGVLLVFCTFDSKVGVAVGVTTNLVNKFDAVKLAQQASIILGGKGGGGRKDFAQAGGINKNKIDDVYKFVIKNIS